MVLLYVFASLLFNDATATRVRLERVPDRGIQPQLVAEADGTLDLLWFRGDPIGGDLFFARSRDGAKSFTPSLRVNRDDGDAVAIGNVRGAQLALGRDGIVHVAWMGAAKSKQRGPKGATPMLTTRLESATAADGAAGATGKKAEAFLPERNVIVAHSGLDGGGSIAADSRGHVWIAWHAPASNDPKSTEADRTIWIATSSDDGKSFGAEKRAWSEPTGACACCGMRAAADDDELVLLYRAAKDEVHRDLYALVSHDAGATFRGGRVDEWRSAQCVMSTAAAAADRGGLLAAWENQGDVLFGRVDGETPGGVKNGRDKTPIATPIRPPESIGGTRAPRKHPALAVNGRGEVLLAWTEGMGWEKGGALVWQLFDAAGRPIPETAGRADGVPEWSLVAAAALADDSFVIVY